jgi:hypothetical protein
MTGNDHETERKAGTQPAFSFWRLPRGAKLYSDEKISRL